METGFNENARKHWSDVAEHVSRAAAELAESLRRDEGGPTIVALVMLHLVGTPLLSELFAHFKAMGLEEASGEQESAGDADSSPVGEPLEG